MTETRKYANDIFAQWNTPLRQNLKLTKTLTLTLTLKKKKKIEHTKGLGLGLAVWLYSFRFCLSGILHRAKILLAHFLVLPEGGMIAVGIDSYIID